MNTLKEQVLEKFLRYVKINTTSDTAAADRGVFPSTEVQKNLANMLVKELRALSINAECTENCYVIGEIPSSPGYEDVPLVMFSAHLDTSDEVSGENVSPVLYTNYDGRIITFSGTTSTLDPAEDNSLAACACRGDTIITSDGTTLLGGDDKAGIAAIMAAVEYFHDNPEIPHGPLRIVFSPDEETGHGMDRVPSSVLAASAAYTVDGGGGGELETECFNAYRADVSFVGVPMHLGYARGKLRNAVTMATDFISLLPHNERPETTDKYEGYYCPLEISGSLEKASVTVFLRDFESSGIEKRSLFLKQLAKLIELRYPGSQVTLDIKKQYLNMKQNLDKVPRVVDLLKCALVNAGGTPVMRAIRGGTDGSRLTEMGLPTPNIFTGGHNFHSRLEWVSLDQLTLSCRTIIELVMLYSKE